MKNTKVVMFAALLLGAGMLGGCTTSGSIAVTPPIGVAPPVVTDPTISAIQDAVAKGCKFVPTVFTITGIVAQFVTGGAPINALVSDVATAICSAVAPKMTVSRLRRAARPVVAGVPVEGYFLK
jgi:hypothetical protein